MPALMAIISGNAEPLRRELAAVQRMANQTGSSLQNMGGGSRGGNVGVIHETLVMMREIGRGNWTRVPGSFTMLLESVGILNMLVKDSSRASQILADAWEKQAATASMAALAATRKAQASEMAFMADAQETEATLNQAAADEEAAAAAITNARAIQAKAIAAREAAAAQEASAALSIGPLGIVAGIIVGIAAGAYAAYTLSKKLVDTLSGLKVPDIHPEYIAKHLKASNQAAEGQKLINKEVARSIELYNSAAQAAQRVADATKQHFDHLRKMASFEKDPVKRAQRELEIDKQERAAELRNKADEQANLEAESKAKKAQADAIRVSSKEEDKNNVDAKKKMADEAQKYLDALQKAEDEKGGVVDEAAKAAVKYLPGGDAAAEAIDKHGFTEALVRGYNSAALSGVSGNDLDAAERANREEAAKRIKAYHDAVDREADNDEARARKKQLTEDAAKAAADAAKIGQVLPQMQKNAAQANKDEDEEMKAQLANERGKVRHGHVSSLQAVGAYTTAASHLDVARQQLHHLASIDKHISSGGHGMTGGGVGRVNYGDTH